MLKICSGIFGLVGGQRLQGGQVGVGDHGGVAQITSRVDAAIAASPYEAG